MTSSNDYFEVKLELEMNEDIAINAVSSATALESAEAVFSASM